MLKDGKLPGKSFLDGLRNYLSDGSRKPTADYIQVQAPEPVNYNIEMVYYIAESNKASASVIQEEVKRAVFDYVCWQGAHSSEITTDDTEAKARAGRDINPDELVMRCRRAGAKRVVITSPVYLPVGRNQIANLENAVDGQPGINITYGGIEGD